METALGKVLLHQSGRRGDESIDIDDPKSLRILFLSRPQERYDKFIAEKPELLWNLPLEVIASYLSMMQKTYSFSGSM